MRNGPDKNPFKGVSDLLSRASPARRNDHFFSYVIDLLLVAIVSYLIFLAGNAIATNTDGYKKNYANYENEITYYQDIVVDAHLAEYLSRDKHVFADSEDLSVKMAISQVLASYSHDKESQYPEFNDDDDPATKLKEIYIGSFYQDAFVEASFADDYISRFFIEYVPTHNENEELVHFGTLTPEKYTIKFIRDHNLEFDQLRFSYPSEDSDSPYLPYLTPSMAKKVYDFLVRAKGYDRTTYDNFVGFYSSMLEDCESTVFKAPSYQTTRYQDYLRYRKNVTVVLDTVLIISIILAYYLAVFLPQMIFKDGRSFGRIFLRLGSINIDKSETEIWKVILRSIFTALSFLYIAFFLNILPPLNGASLVLYLPFITIGALDISLINIVITIFLLAATNGIFMLLTHEKRNLFDLIFKTVTVDVTMIDEPDYDEKNEAGM